MLRFCTIRSWIDGDAERLLGASIVQDGEWVEHINPPRSGRFGCSDKGLA